MNSSWLSLLLSLPLGSYPANNLEGAEWRVLTDGSTHVACSKQPDITWCRSTAVINGSKDKLAGILKDFENYPQIFKRVYKTKVLEPNVVHVLLDMPFPLKLRDYIAQFEETEEGDHLVFTFNSVDHAEAALPSGDSVRLPRAAGQWRLEPVSGTQTRVTYTWNGELLGNIATFQLPTAWKTQGTEVMEWLEEAVEE
ncbi:MAG: hypothetical protein VXW32_04240 [Myxococcota bacterium]|nr:hypothetical protein [Myxococcota bacterium]